MNTPFASRGPLQDGMFVGRAHELNEIGSFLRANQSVSIVGPPKIGKTSLMLQLQRTEMLSALQMWQSHLLIYIDCRVLSGSRPDEIFVSLCRELTAAARGHDIEPEMDVRVAASRPARLTFEAGVRRLNEHGRRVVFMLDEFEALALNPRVDVGLFNALRSAAGRLRLAFVTASAEPLFGLPSFSSPNKLLASPFFNVFAQLFLGLLSEPEARTLIRASLESADVVIQPQLEDFIYELAGGHPLALQIACNRVRPRRGDREGIAQHTAQELKSYFEYAWDRLSSTERQVLQSPARVVKDASDPAIRRTLRDLAQKCLLVEKNGSYAYPSKAWGEFVLSTTCGSVVESLVKPRPV